MIIYGEGDCFTFFVFYLTPCHKLGGCAGVARMLFTVGPSYLLNFGSFQYIAYFKNRVKHNSTFE